MAAMLKLCPKEIQDMVELRWDEIGEEYEKLRDRVIGWATTRAEKKGGPVPMDVDGVDKGNEKDEENEEEEYWDTNAVTASTQCYNCQGYGHTSWQCPSKGKGEGGKGGGKGSDKGKGGVGGKGWQGKGWQGKGGWEGVEAKGGGKGAAKGGKGKGDKGGGKGWGYQGVCWKCNKIGHKANECWEGCPIQGLENEGETEGDKKEVGGVWVVASVDEKVPIRRTRFCDSFGWGNGRKCVGGGNAMEDAKATKIMEKSRQSKMMEKSRQSRRSEKRVKATRIMEKSRQSKLMEESAQAQRSEDAGTEEEGGFKDLRDSGGPDPK